MEKEKIALKLKRKDIRKLIAKIKSVNKCNDQFFGFFIPKFMVQDSEIEFNDMGE